MSTGGSRGKLAGLKKHLAGPGVYVLYRDEKPYYVGKASTRLFGRLYSHARNANGRYFNFWNMFSAFVVPRADLLPQIEGILIASMPTANSAKPRIARLRFPASYAKSIREMSEVVTKRFLRTELKRLTRQRD